MTYCSSYRRFAPTAILLASACASGGEKPQPTLAAAPVAQVKTAAQLNDEANSALEAREYEAAVVAYDEVLAKDPDNVGVKYNRAFALHQSGDLTRARAGYEEVLQLEPTSTDAAINLAALLKQQGEAERAVEVTKAGLQNAPFNPRLLNNLSVLERERGRYKEGIQAVRTLLMRDKTNVDAYKNLSLIYFEQKKYRLSQTILENALKMSKEQGRKDPDIYVNLGMIYLARAENGKAMAAFKKAKAIEPEHTVANYNIGSLALGHRDYGLAASSYETVSKAWVDNYEVVVGHGYALQGQGKLAEAATRLEEARTLLAKLPTKPAGDEDQILLQLMVIYQNQENAAKALEYAEQYMTLKNLTCGEEDFDGFCGRYNGIKLMIEMAASEAQPATEEKREAKDVSETSIFTEGAAEEAEPGPDAASEDAAGPVDGVN